MANILESPTNIEDEAFEEEINVEREDFELVVPENYDDLLGLPQINGVTLTGNKTSSDLGIITQEQVDNAIQTESQARSSADTELNNKINAESTARGEADTALGTRIDDEALARQSADNGLQSQIDAITSQSDVVDVVANYAALQAYDTSTLSDNDVIKVLDDETHEDALTYYRWSITTQTWSYIGQEAPYYSKGQMDVKLAEKQDKLTAGANIQIQNGTISATDTTYTAGNGLNLNGTEFSADTTELATKSDLDNYYTKTETDNLLAPKLETEVVAELPTAGEEGKLYLTPKAHTTQTATGNPITATVAEDAGALESFQLDGDTFQQTYTGKNLYKWGNVTFSSDVTSSSWCFPDGSTGAYGANITSKTTYKLTLPSGTYYLSAYDVSSNIERINLCADGDSAERVIASPNGSFNLSEETVVVIRYRVTNPSLGIGNTKLQLETGSTATSYEPYVGGQPSPSPEYPQPIQVVTGEQTVEIVGKNLFDKDDVVNGIPSASDGTIVSTTSIGRASGFIRVKSSTNYSHTGHPNGWATIAWYKENKSFISRTDNATTTTSPTEAAFARVSCASTDLNTCQFEEGQPTDYVPYSKQTLPLDLGDIQLCGLGDDGNGNPLYKDYIYPDGEEWKIHKAIGKYVYGDDLAQNGISETMVSMVTPTLPVIRNLAHDSGICQSNMYNPIDQNGTGLSGTTGTNKIRIYTAISIANSYDAVRQLASANNLTIYYPLDTATDTVITDQTLIAQLEAIRTAMLQNGANTITNTATGSNLAGDMEIGYYGFNPRNRYDKWLWLDINNEYEQIGS